MDSPAVSESSAAPTDVAIEPKEEQSLEIKTEEPPEPRKPPPAGQLYLRIVEAKLNSTPDLIGGLRVLTFVNEVQGDPSWKESTEYSRLAPNPKWNEDFIVSVPNPEQQSDVTSGYVAKYQLDLSKLELGKPEDVWLSPLDSALSTCKLRIVVYYHVGDIPKQRDSQVNVVLPMLQIHLDRPFVFPGETVSGIVSLSAWNEPLTLASPPNLSIGGLQSTVFTDTTGRATMKYTDEDSLFEERQKIPLETLVVPVGTTFSWRFSLQLPADLPPSLAELIVYLIRCYVALKKPIDPATNSRFTEPTSELKAEARFCVGGPLAPADAKPRRSTARLVYYHPEDDLTESNAAHHQNIISTMMPENLKIAAGGSGPEDTRATLSFTLPPANTLTIGGSSQITVRIENTLVPSLISVTGWRLKAAGLTLTRHKNEDTQEEKTFVAVVKPGRTSMLAVEMPHSDPDSLNDLLLSRMFEEASGKFQGLNALPGATLEKSDQIDLPASLWPSVSSNRSKLIMNMYELEVVLKAKDTEWVVILPVNLCMPLPKDAREMPPSEDGGETLLGQRVLVIEAIGNVYSIPAFLPDPKKAMMTSGARWYNHGVSPYGCAVQLSALSLGAWITYGGTVKEDEVAFQCMNTAYEAGVNFFDNAETYANGQAELMMGRLLKRSGWRRSEIVISTKIFFGIGDRGPNAYGLSRKHIMEGMADSLKRLQLDYVDVVFCHRPDFTVPVEETVRAFNTLIQQGKCSYWGTSEWPAHRIQQAITCAKSLGLIGPIVEQPQYSLLHRSRVEKEYLPLYDDEKMGLTTWSPLASGILTGKYLESIPPGSRLSTTEWLRKQFESGQSMNGLEMKDHDMINSRVVAMEAVAEKLECSRAQLALAWCLKNRHVSSVITGASKPAQVAENIKALDIYRKLSNDVMEEIDTIFANRPAPDFDWNETARDKQRTVAAARLAATQ